MIVYGLVFLLLNPLSNLKKAMTDAGLPQHRCGVFEKHNIETKDKSRFDVAHVNAMTPNAFDSTSLLHSSRGEAPEARPTPRAAPSQHLHSPN